MSDSEDDFASADEGDAGSHTEKSKPEKSEEKPKEKEGAKAVDTGKQTKPESKKTSGKGEQPAANTKKGKDAEAKKSSAATKPQEASSASGGKGKQSGNQKKSKQKGGKKVWKEVTVKTEPAVTETTTNKDDKSSESDKTTQDAMTESDKMTQDIKADTDLKSETTDSDIQNMDDKRQSPVSKTEASNVKEVKTNSENSSDVKPDVKSETQSADDRTDSQSMDESSVSQSIQSDPADVVKSPSSQSIPRPKPDHTDDQEKVLEKLAGAAQEPKQSGWGWGWGSSLLNVASNSVSTFTNQVGEGFNTMLETVESTLNVPSPEDLVMKKPEEGSEGEKESAKECSTEGATAESTKTDEDKSHDQDKPITEASGEAGDQSPQDSSNSWFSSWGVGNITKMVESTGKNLVTGGLDVLETLGKKTFDALNEHDPGLKKTRGLLTERGDKPNLSAILRDACDQHEERVKMEKESEEARKVHFGTLFDDFQGLAHLEALEILSNQSERKVNSLLTALPPDIVAALKPQLLEIKANFEIGEEEEEEVDEHNFTELLTDIYSQLNVGVSPDKLTRVQTQIRESLKDLVEKKDTEDKPALKDIHLVAIRSLAEFTSKSIEQFHKAGEMILLQRAQNSDFVSASNNLNSLTKVLCTEVGILSTKFTECLNNNTEGEDTTNVNQLVTSVYLEASNSSSYVQDGFQLLLPVLQQADIEKNQEPAS